MPENLPVNVPSLSEGDIPKLLELGPVHYAKKIGDDISTFDLHDPAVFTHLKQLFVDGAGSATLKSNNYRVLKLAMQQSKQRRTELSQSALSNPNTAWMGQTLTIDPVSGRLVSGVPGLDYGQAISVAREAQLQKDLDTMKPGLSPLEEVFGYHFVPRWLSATALGVYQSGTAIPVAGTIGGRAIGRWLNDADSVRDFERNLALNGNWLEHTAMSAGRLLPLIGVAYMTGGSSLISGASAGGFALQSGAQGLNLAIASGLTTPGSLGERFISGAVGGVGGALIPAGSKIASWLTAPIASRAASLVTRLGAPELTGYALETGIHWGTRMMGENFGFALAETGRSFLMGEKADFWGAYTGGLAMFGFLKALGMMRYGASIFRSPLILPTGKPVYKQGLGVELAMGERNVRKLAGEFEAIKKARGRGGIDTIMQEFHARGMDSALGKLLGKYGIAGHDYAAIRMALNYAKQGKVFGPNTASKILTDPNYAQTEVSRGPGSSLANGPMDRYLANAARMRRGDPVDPRKFDEAMESVAMEVPAGQPLPFQPPAVREPFGPAAERMKPLPEQEVMTEEVFNPRTGLTETVEKKGPKPKLPQQPGPNDATRIEQGTAYADEVFNYIVIPNEPSDVTKATAAKILQTHGVPKNDRDNPDSFLYEQVPTNVAKLGTIPIEVRPDGSAVVTTKEGLIDLLVARSLKIPHVDVEVSYVENADINPDVKRLPVYGGSMDADVPVTSHFGVPPELMQMPRPADPPRQVVKGVPALVNARVVGAAADRQLRQGSARLARRYDADAWKRDRAAFEDPETSPLEHDQFVVVSADVKGMDPASREHAARRLLDMLRREGYADRVIPVRGRYMGTDEASFLVIGMTDLEGLRYGRLFGQESILTPRGVMFTEGGKVAPADPTQRFMFDSSMSEDFSEMQIDGQNVRWRMNIPSFHGNALVPYEELIRRGEGGGFVRVEVYRDRRAIILNPGRDGYTAYDAGTEPAGSVGPIKQVIEVPVKEIYDLGADPRKFRSTWADPERAAKVSGYAGVRDSTSPEPNRIKMFKSFQPLDQDRGYRHLKEAARLREQAAREALPADQAMEAQARRIEEMVRMQPENFPTPEARMYALAEAAKLRREAEAIRPAVQFRNARAEEFQYDQSEPPVSAEAPNDPAATVERFDNASAEAAGKPPRAPEPVHTETKATTVESMEQSLLNRLEQSRLMRAYRLRGKNKISRKDVRRLAEYYFKLKTAVENDYAPAKYPKAPAWLRNYVEAMELSPADVLREIETVLSTPGVSARKAAANVVAPNSRIAAGLASGKPEEFHAAVKEASDTGLAATIITEIKPAIEADMAVYVDTDAAAAGVEARPTQPRSDMPSSGPAPVVPPGGVGKTDVPSLFESYRNSRDNIKRWLEEFPSGDSTLEGLALHGGTEVGSANAWDYLRGNNSRTFLKLFPAKFAGPILYAIRRAAITENTRLHLLRNHLDEAKSDFIDTLRTMPDEGRAKVHEMLKELKEGHIAYPPDMDPRVVRIIESVRTILNDARRMMAAMNEPILDEDYFPMMAKQIDKHMGPDSKVRGHYRDVTSRFMQSRYGKVSEMADDFFHILDVYNVSVGRVAAFRPIQDAVQAFLADVKARGGKIPLSAEKWLGHQFDAMLGRPGWLDGLMEDAFQLLFRTSKARSISHAVGRGIIAVNYLGALAFRPVSAFKNLLGGLPAVSDIGPAWFLRGINSVVIKGPNGKPVLNPLLNDLGLMEASLSREATFGDPGQFRSRLAAGLSSFGRDLRAVGMGLFDLSETLVRGGAAIGAYKKAKAMRHPDGRPVYTEDGARAYAMEAAVRTQADYSKHLGNILGYKGSFSGTSGRFLFQFGRFGINALDYLQLSLRAGLGSKTAKRLLMRGGVDGRAPVDNSVTKLFGLMGGAIAMANLLLAMGVHIEDASGPGGAIPDLPKHLAELGLVTAGRAVKGDIKGELWGRDAARMLGIDSRGRDVFDSLVMSTGPGVGQIAAGFGAIGSIFSTLPDERHAAISRLTRQFQTMPPGLAVHAFKRGMDEFARGYIASQVSGDRLYPEMGKRLDPEEALARMTGFQPRTLAEAYMANDDSKFVMEVRNSVLADAKAELFNALDDKHDPGKATARYVARLKDLADDTGEYLLLSEAGDRINTLFKEYEERRILTQRERREQRRPGPISFSQLVER